MKGFIGKKVLVTTQDWFVGRNGCSFKAVYGILESVDELKDVLGFVPSRHHANWSIKVGSFIIIGCQVQNIEQTDIIHDSQEPVSDFSVDKSEVSYFERPSTIYFY